MDAMQCNAMQCKVMMKMMNQFARKIWKWMVGIRKYSSGMISMVSLKMQNKKKSISRRHFPCS